MDPAQVAELRDRRRASTGSIHPKPDHPLRCVRLRYEDTPELGPWMTDYGPYEANGVLPYSGGLRDQPARWVEAMQIIGGILGNDT